MDNQDLLKNVSKWVVLMGIDGEHTHHIQKYLKWKEHKENLQIKGTVENLIYRFYDGKPNYKKLIDDVQFLYEMNKYMDKPSVAEKIMLKKQRGITTISPPTKEEAENSYDDFGYVNLNNDISVGEYQKLFDDYCKNIGKKFASKKQQQQTLEELMKGTYNWSYGMLDHYLHDKYTQWKRNNGK